MTDTEVFASTLHLRGEWFDPIVLSMELPA